MICTHTCGVRTAFTYTCSASSTHFSASCFAQASNINSVVCHMHPQTRSVPFAQTLLRRALHTLQIHAMWCAIRSPMHPHIRAVLSAHTSLRRASHTHQISVRWWSWTPPTCVVLFAHTCLRCALHTHQLSVRWYVLDTHLHVL